MKTIILLFGIVIVFIAATISYDQQEGVILYEAKVNLHKMLTAARQEEKAMLPEFRVTKQQLFFNSQESLYKPVLEDDEEEDFVGSSGTFRIKLKQPNIIIYSNPEKEAFITQREFMGKNYLITDSTETPPWKIGTDKKTILGYECSQAYYTDETNKETVTAWYTMQLRPMLGPDKFHTLPGAVLAIDINNGERTTVATNIEFRALKKNEMKVPSSGTAITRADFKKMVEEETKKMGGGGGRIMIRN